MSTEQEVRDAAQAHESDSGHGVVVERAPECVFAWCRECEWGDSYYYPVPEGDDDAGTSATAAP